MNAYCRIIPGLLILTWLCCATQRAESETIAYPEIPTRLQLPAVADPPGQNVSQYTPDTPIATLEQIIRSQAPLQQRVDAVRCLADDLDRSYTDSDYIPFIQSLIRVANWLLSKEGDLGFRRYGVYMLFAEAYTKVNSTLPNHSEDHQEWVLWKSVEMLRSRGIRDKDPRLAEYFERYIPLKRDPNWKEVEARMRRVTRQIVKTLPQYKTDLRERLAMVDSIQDSQLTVQARLDAALAASGLSQQMIVQLTRATDQEFTYRLYTLWNNLYARTIIETIEPENARRFGVTAGEVKFGWPELIPPNTP